ncbi:hypothetical protein CGRA01v4_10719 [Colletotrichum graminicola]|nr:hypothetical protein CGRA01v4_10719 [Colletotrichum graminicola]
MSEVSGIPSHFAPGTVIVLPSWMKTWYMRSGRKRVMTVNFFLVSIVLPGP